MSALKGYSNQSGRNDGIAVPHTYTTPPFEILATDPRQTEEANLKFR